MEVKLVMFKQDGQRREFLLKKETTTLGRNTDCDFQIPLGVISRRHCQVLLKNDAVSVRDLGSSNGTFVNSRRVTESPIAPGDTIVVGPVIFTVVINGNPAEIQPVRTIVDGGSVAPVNTHHQEDGTVDVEASASGHGHELEDVDESASGEPAGDNPLAALEALSKKKQ